MMTKSISASQDQVATAALIKRNRIVSLARSCFKDYPQKDGGMKYELKKDKNKKNFCDIAVGNWDITFELIQMNQKCSTSQAKQNFEFQSTTYLQQI
jgi:hypothetical protein